MGMFRTARTAPIAAAFVLAPALLAGCATLPAPNAPSLLPRAIETRSDAVPVATIAPPTVDAAFDPRIAERVAAVTTAAKAFDSAEPALSPKITRARGAVQGSERWLDAQSAFGELQQLRTATDGAMADLEALAIERASAGLLPYPALDAAIAAAQVTLDRQAAIENRLRAVLPT